MHGVHDLRDYETRSPLMNHKTRPLCLTAVVWITFTSCLCAQTPPSTLTVDCSDIVGTIRALHGVNSGPIHAGETLDLSADHREVGIPVTRLHDCHWPNADVVDIHVIFPNFDADPSLPGSYDFTRTDDYIQSIIDVGSEIVFRLGESIEHSKRKYHVHPPTDADKWAAVCVGIVRHYNEGWAGGFHHKIRYWEIWNEPENRPAMWTGTDEQYYELYTTTAKAIKSRFPDVLVGGPAVGYAGRLQGEVLEPSQFVQGFLERCRRDSVPLDFFSWHTYTADPVELVRRSRAIRRLLDEAEFPRAENHLNEWNYLPDGDWSPMLTSNRPVRQAWFDRIRGAEGAAFTAAALILLQSAPIDVANFYSADIHGFGTFSEHGVRYKNYYALKAFKMLLDTPLRISVEGAMPNGIAVAAGMNRERTRVTILASNVSPNNQTLKLQVVGLPKAADAACEVLLLDSQHDLEPVQSRHIADNNGILEGIVEQPLPAASVVVVVFQP